MDSILTPIETWIKACEDASFSVRETDFEQQGEEAVYQATKLLRLALTLQGTITSFRRLCLYCGPNPSVDEKNFCLKCGAPVRKLFLGEE